jgi:hypothetical protein
MSQGRILLALQEQQRHSLYPESYQDLPPLIYTNLFQLHYAKPVGFRARQKCYVRYQAYDAKIQIVIRKIRVSRPVY